MTSLPRICLSAAAVAVSASVALAAAPDASAAGFKLQRVTSGVGQALYVTHAPGENNRLFLVNQNGTIQILDRGRLLSSPFLNVKSRISSGGEQGLLGLAFHPKYATNGKFYVNYTDRGGDTQVVEFRRASKNRAKTSGRRLLTVDQPFSNHNGGHLAFGPDGFLYISTGDGGGGGDPVKAGQNVNTLLGKLLRIDVDSRRGGRPYGIPASNPFRTNGRPEIYSYGLRNPWRFSFDRTRGDLWIGDVGQDAIEEINFRPKGKGAGANFGWNAFEGSNRFGGTLKGSKHILPVAQHTHGSGFCSITGGYVYRGSKIPALRGRYVYSDFCSGQTFTMRAGPRPGGTRDDSGMAGVTLGGVKSFGESADGTLYVLANGSLYRFVNA